MEDTITLYPNSPIRANSGIPSKVGKHMRMTEVDIDFSSLGKVARNKLSRFLRQGWIDGGYGSVPAELAEFIFKHTKTPYMRMVSQSSWRKDVDFRGFDFKNPCYDEMFRELDAYAQMILLTTQPKDRDEERYLKELRTEPSLLSPRDTPWGYVELYLVGAKDHMDVVQPLFRQHVWRPLGIDPAKRFAAY